MENGHDQHMRRVGREPIPTRSEQLLLGRSIRSWLDWPDGPDEAPARVQRRGRRALNRLVSGNLRLVASAARKYLHSGAEIDDLMQAGAEGLICAARKFDPTAGYSFTTYAMAWIRQSFQRGVMHRMPHIRMPDNLTQMALQARGVAGNLEARLGRAPTVEEVAAQMGEKATPAQVRNALSSFARTECTSLSVPLGEAGDTRATKQDFVVDDSVDLWEEAEKRDQIELVRKALCYLQPEESLLIRRVVYGNETFAVIARERGVTREAVRQRWAKTVQKIQQYVGA